MQKKTVNQTPTGASPRPWAIARATQAAIHQEPEARAEAVPDGARPKLSMRARLALGVVAAVLPLWALAAWLAWGTDKLAPIDGDLAGAVLAATVLLIIYSGLLLLLGLSQEDRQVVKHLTQQLAAGFSKTGSSTRAGQKQ